LLTADFSRGDEFFEFFFHCNIQQSINHAIIRI
jgi:hypothetical protein